MAPAIVQSKIVQAGASVTTLAATFTSAVTAGNAILVASVSYSGADTDPGTTNTVADSRSNTYTQDSHIYGTSGGQHMYTTLYSAPNVAAGTTTVTLTKVQATYATIAIMEVSGLATSSMLDTQVATTTFGTVGSTGTTAATTSASAFAFSAATTGAGAYAATVSGTGTYVTGPTLNTGTPVITVATQVLTATGTQSATYTYSGNGDITAALAVYKAAAGGGVLTAGTITITGTTTTTASATVSVATGGTAPYTYQWYRSTTSGFTPGAGNILAGQTATSLSDTGLTTGTTYYYKVVVTDNVAATATTTQAAATPNTALTSGTITVGTIGATTVALSIGAASGGTLPYTYQWYRSTTTGFTPGAGNILAGQTALNLNDSGLTTGTTYYWKVVTTDNVAATATSAQATATPANALAVTVATPTATTTTVTLVATPAAGTAPYTYQWYRGVDSLMPVDGTTILAGATSATLTNTPPNAKVAWYICKVTDNVAATATSVPIPAVLYQTALKIGFIGDSLGLVGNSTTPDTTAPTLTGNTLRKMYGVRNVTIVNQHVSGSASSGWTSGSSNLIAAKAAFASAGVTYVMYMIGINGVNQGTVTEATLASNVAPFTANVTSTCNDLVAAGYTVILNVPPWNASVNTGVNAQLQAYGDAMATVANGTTIRMGDTTAFAWFSQNQSELSDGTHPTFPVGTGSLAAMWAKAFYTLFLAPATSGSAGRRRPQ